MAKSVLKNTLRNFKAKTLLRNLITQIVKGVPISNPRAVFIGGVDGFWLDPSDLDSLWVDQARTQHPTAPGDVVWWIDDKSPNLNHFGAVSSAARGRLYRWSASAVLEGYPRNLLSSTDDLTQWITSSGEVSVQSGIDDPDGGNTAFRVTGVESQWRLVINNARIPLETNCTLTVWARSISGPAVMRFYAAGYAASTIPITNEWVKYEIPFTTGSGNGHLFQLRLNQNGQQVDFWRPQVEVGNSATQYQSVGQDVYDVTEEGQPDCWGIGFDGVSTRYVSTRGIPLFAMNRLRAAMGATKLGVDGVSGGGGNPLSNRASGSNTNNSVGLGMHQIAASYNLRYRSNENANIAESLDYPSPHSAVLDVMVDAGVANCFVRVNNAAPLTSPTINPGVINGDQWSLGADLNGTSFANFILWGTILVAEEPDETQWDAYAKEWMSVRRMGNILESQFSAESRTLFAAMQPPPNYAQKVAIDRFMKDAWLPVWDRMDGIYIRHSYASQPSLLNWKNPSEMTTPVNSPVFFPYSGWQGDGVSARLSNPTPLSAYTLNNCHYMSSQVIDVGPVAANPRLGDGATEIGGRRLNYYPRNAANERPIFSNGSPQPTVASVDPTLLTVINRTSATGFDIYDNGVFTESALQESISNPQLPLYELAFPNANQFGNMRISIFTFGAALTPTEITNINTAWIAYKAAMVAP